MSGRRTTNRIRGPQSALTDFLAANNISAGQIRADFESRSQQAAANDGNAGEGPATRRGRVAAETDQEGASEGADDNEDDGEDMETKVKRRKQSNALALEKAKKQKSMKKGKGIAKKRGSDDDDYEDDLGRDMYKKSRPVPGQFENCEICSKRFTVTPYTKEGPDGGLLCTPCGKEMTNGLKKEARAAKKPVGRKRRKLESDKLDGIAVHGVKSLRQLCIEQAAKYHESIDELGDVPHSIVDKLSEIFSKKRVMKPSTLPLFLRPDLSSVVVHDAAYLESEDYHKIFATVPGLKRLVLGNACQFKDDNMDYMLDRCASVHHIHLYGANLISDKMWFKTFLIINKRLEVIQLKWLDASFDDAAVRSMVHHCPNLKRVKFKFCRRIGREAIKSLSALKKLEHISLQPSDEIDNEVLIGFIQKCGSSLRTLSLEKFMDADDSVLSAISDNCEKLTKLRFSDNDRATDFGYASLFAKTRNSALTFADFSSTRSIDNTNPDGPEEVIGLGSAGFQALMAHSGSHLKHLDVSSCRHISLQAFTEVFNPGNQYPALEHLNISFCNRVDTCLLSGIFKSCPALKRVVAFGCFNIQEVVFVPRNITLIGVPRATESLEQFGTGMDVQEAIDRTAEVSILAS